MGYLKKITLGFIIGIAIMIAALHPVHAITYFNVSPTAVKDNQTITVTSSDWSNLEVFMYEPSAYIGCPAPVDVTGNCGFLTTNTSFTLRDLTTNGQHPSPGAWHFVAVALNDSNTCNTGTYADCIASTGYLGQDTIVTLAGLGPFSVPWLATSTTQGWTYPSRVNGVDQTAVAPNFIATSSFSSIIPYASTTALSADVICLNNDICRTMWPTGGGGGSGTVSTSTHEIAGRLAYWNSNSATPALLGQVATGTLTGSGPISVTANTSIIGSNATVSCPTCNTSSASVTSVGTNNGLTGGPITTSGTIGLDITKLITNSIIGWNGSIEFATGTADLTAGYFNATTSKASNFPYASTTAITATTASSTNLIVSGLGGSSTRCLQVNADGTVAANSAACSTASGTVNNGVFGQLTFYGATGNTVSGTSTIVVGTTTADANNTGIGGTTTPGTVLSINNIANFSAATSSFYGNGLNLKNGCFAINGACVGSTNGTVTSVATNNGLTGGTITTSGTIGLDISKLITNAAIGWNGSQEIATGTSDFTMGYFNATSTAKNATSTIQGNLLVSNCSGEVLAPSGVFSTNSSPQIEDCNNGDDLLSNITVRNISATANAGPCVTWENDISPGSSGISATNFMSGCLVSSKFKSAILPGLGPSDFVWYNASGNILYDAASTVIGSSSQIWCDGPGFLINQCDMFLVQQTSGLANLGLGTTTPWRNLSVAGASDLGFNALSGYFTATSTIQTSIFNGAFKVSTSSPNALTVTDKFGTNALNVQTSSSTGAILSVVSTTTANLNLFSIDQFGHQTASSTATPTISTCGTTPVLGFNANDVVGHVTTGTGSPTVCTVNFGSPYSAVPEIFITMQTPTTTPYISTASTTFFTVSFSTTTVSAAFSYYVLMP